MLKESFLETIIILQKANINKLQSLIPNKYNIKGLNQNKKQIKESEKKNELLFESI